MLLGIKLNEQQELVLKVDLAKKLKLTKNCIQAIRNAYAKARLEKVVYENVIFLSSFLNYLETELTNKAKTDTDPISLGQLQLIISNCKSLSVRRKVRNNRSRIKIAA